MTQIGGDAIDKLLEDDLSRTRKPSDSKPTRHRRRHTRSSSRHRRRRRRSPSLNDMERKLRKQKEDIERDQRTIFANQIHPRVDERDIFEFFSQCGRVRDVQLIRDTQSGRSKGLCYIEFHKKESVATALTFTGQLLGGYPINVQVTQSEKNRMAAAALDPSVTDGPMKLYISQIDKELTENDLEPIFEPFGKIDEIRIERKLDPKSGLKKGFVHFRRSSEATTALMNLNGLTLLKQSLVISQSEDSDNMSNMNRLAGSLVKTSEVPGATTQVLDEGHSGLQMSANTRALLMKKLQASANPTQNLVVNPNPIETVSQSTNGTHLSTISHVESRFMQLKNMFDPSNETDDNWVNEIQEDVKAECSKFGRVLMCKVDKNSLGHVFIEYEKSSEAQTAALQLNGRWFSQKAISAEVITEDVFKRRCPK